jgi:hypothetical protein
VGEREQLLLKYRQPLCLPTVCLIKGTVSGYKQAQTCYYFAVPDAKTEYLYFLLASFMHFITWIFFSRKIVCYRCQLIYFTIMNKRAGIFKITLKISPNQKKLLICVCTYIYDTYIQYLMKASLLCITALAFKGRLQF